MLIIVLLALILCSAFFSTAETSMMAVNRYRLRHLSRKSHRAAIRALRLLERPDRLLGVILIGNTFCTILASAIATIIAVNALGDMGALIATVVMTLVFLIFGETAPKTLAVMFSQRVALLVSGPLLWLLKLLYPLVWVVNGVANTTLRLFGVRIKKSTHDTLSLEELRAIVHEAAGRGSSHYQDMLLRVLDLQQVTVDEVMVPKHEVYGIDLSQDWPSILTVIFDSPHAYLPVYYERIDKIRGMISLRTLMRQLQKNTITKVEDLLAFVEEVYFIPASVLLHQQVLNFQQQKKRVGLVVDEYGDVQGLLTLKDVLEEIVGDFEVGSVEAEQHMERQPDNSILVDGSMSVRDLNRLVGWHLPVHGPRTLSGLIIEHLEIIPTTVVCIRIADYLMEVVSVSEHTIEKVRIWVSAQPATSVSSSATGVHPY